MASETELIARCLCGKHVFTASVPSSSLPLKATACHCTSCRHSTGGLFMADVDWPKEDVNLSGLKCYAFSPKINIYSCGNCSAKMFCKAQAGPGVFTSALENASGLVKYNEHIFVGDTKDGGASSWLLASRGPGGRDQIRWSERSDKGEQLDASWPGNSVVEKRDTATPDVTPIWCHCKGVKLFLKSGRDLASSTDETPFKKPEQGTGRYITHIDACDSCRMVVGSDFVHWAFAPINHLYYSAEEAERGSSPFENIGHLREAVQRCDAQVGTLVMYRSSEGVERYHCSNCSATIFYTEHGLPHQVDIAIGVLDHPDGARAEGLLAWDRGQIDHVKDTKGGWREDLAEGYLKGASGAGA